MSQIIAGLYELDEKIGSGGGGTVYRGRHIRLEKQIVLKADKRQLSTAKDKLRREVDLLKNLTHTYIPQVYDFVQDDGVVYTVMDYIDGESLDKLLERQQIPSQPQVIHWACQLLEALSYLHSQPPYGILHGDIKPANIMLRPNGDVCLIDFNIALALGEDGAVKVGFSRGYASPEHYGIEYSQTDKTTGRQRSHVRASVSDATEVDSDEIKTEVMDEQYPVFSAGSVSRTQSGKLLDVRSDIYSLGATLYHLISGRRPAQNAEDVLPLGTDVCSAAVSKILKKAMAPRPEQRYQTAEEMLRDFRQLHFKDPRAVRHRRRIRVSAAMLIGVFLAGGACTFAGLKQMEQRQTALALAEYSAGALAEGDISGAVDLALQALEGPLTAQAQKALTDALGVYDLSNGFKSLDTLELPGAPFDIAISPEGTRFAVVYAYEAAVYDTVDLKRIAVLPIQKSAYSDCIFLDEESIVYAGEQGVAVYDLSGQKIKWVGEAATKIALSADKSVAAAVNRDDNKAVLYRTGDGTKVAECSFGDLHMPVAANDIFADSGDTVFSLNEDGSMLAVSFYNGGLMIFDINHSDNDLILYDESEYDRFGGGFCGDYFAFSAQNGKEAQFGIVDVQRAEFVGGFTSQDKMLLQADENGVYLASGNLLVRVNLETFEEEELAYLENANMIQFSIGKEYVLAASDDNRFLFYDKGANLALEKTVGEPCDFVRLFDGYAMIANRSDPVLRIMKEERHDEEQLLTYDAHYRHDEARISGNGQTAMLFSFRGFAIYDMDGNLINQIELPDAAQIYDQQFRKDEDASCLEVTWYDGTVRCYDAGSGSMISEIKGDAPKKDLYEEFYTDRYRIASALHSAPEVYDIVSGKLVTTLETDSYLTYVTQADEYLITEYVSAAGERYGLLLDKDLQTVAYLPKLCDISGDMLVFDYESGNLRQCRLYSLPELIALGETYH